MTAYVGLLDIGKPKAGDTVFVSAAAGAVGSMVCQMAKIKRCRVALNYKAVASLVDEVGRHCPDGIDVYFDNVGGDHLEAALEHMNPFGRIALCGMISQYNEAKAGPSNLSHAVRKRLTMQGFIVSDHAARLSAFHQDMQTWINAGQIRWEETIVDGIDKAPKAFIGLFTGDNMGKMLVRLHDASDHRL
jgi:NADPH-dependent curcumin reductase CurA